MRYAASRNRLMQLSDFGMLHISLFKEAKQVIERLRQSGMSKDGILEYGIGKFAHYGNLEHSHNLATFNTQDGTAKNLRSIGIDDGLHETTRLVYLQGPRHIVHRHFGYFDIVALCACLCLTHTYATKLWVDENSIRNQASSNSSVSIFQKIGTNDTEIVVGDMGKGRASFDIAQSIDAWNIGFKFIVDLDKAMFVGHNAGYGEVEPIGIRGAACCYQQMRTSKGTLFC